MHARAAARQSQAQRAGARTDVDHELAGAHAGPFDDAISELRIEEVLAEPPTADVSSRPPLAGHGPSP